MASDILSNYTTSNRLEKAALIKAFYTRGIWEALGYMLWHGYTTRPTVTRLVQDRLAVELLDNRL